MTQHLFFVMPDLVPGIHAFLCSRKQDVDGRDKPGHDRVNYKPSTIRAGSSRHSFTRTRKVTAARPMMYLALSYDHRIVDGRASILPAMTTGRSWILCMPRMPDC